jgi:hypothetical protein
MTDDPRNLAMRHRFGATASDLLRPVEPGDDPANISVTSLPAGLPREVWGRRIAIAVVILIATGILAWVLW